MINTDLLNSDWRPKNHYPSLKDAKLIAVDTETKDPNLLEKGCGGIRGDGYITGFSVATDDGFSGYYPIKQGGDNVDNPEAALTWLREEMGRPEQPKVGANLLYDLEWLRVTGIEVKGKKYDVQIAEPLLDENQRTYRLDAIAERQLGVHKDETMLIAAGRTLLGLKGTDAEVSKKVKGEQWRLPARYVGAYGERDASLPIEIFKKQEKLLKADDLWDVFIVETELIDILLEMKFKGVPVNISKAEQVANKLQAEYDTAMRSIKRRCGFEPNIWASEDIVKACKTLGLEFPCTAKGNASFESAWLDEQDHEFFKQLAMARKLDRGGSVFVKSKIIDLAVNGRIHPSFWQVKNDSHGTVAGRFCVSGDTKLKTDKGTIEISELNLNKGSTYSILSHRGNWKRIVNRFYKGKEAMYKVTLTNGASLTMTSGHKILTFNGWRSLYELNIGNEMVSYKDTDNTKRDEQDSLIYSKETISNIAYIGEKDVWDIEVEDDHSYIAQGFINHNSSSNPNLQQVPSRHPVIAPMIRSIFESEPGKQWGAFDYKQQEICVTLHYSNVCGMPGAAEALQKYKENPKTDYHTMVAEMANITRKQAKTINLGLSYGMGPDKLAESLGLSKAEAQALSNKYHTSLPYIRALGDRIKRVVNERGYIRTLLGRRRRFNLYGPADWAKGMIPKPYEEAIKEFGKPVKRYFLHKALNSLIQGSSADMIKKALVDGYHCGYVPHITIHDENDYSIESEKQAREIRDIMLNCVQLTVPLKVDVEIGPNWGETKEVEL